MDLFRLILDADGAVLEQDKVALDDVTPAMRIPFLGPFNGGSGSAEIPVGGGKYAVMTWDGAADGTARGEFVVDEVVHVETVLVSGRDPAADAAALADFAARQDDGDDILPQLTAIDRRPLLVGVQAVPGWPAELAGADVILAAVFLAGLPDPPDVS